MLLWEEAGGGQLAHLGGTAQTGRRSDALVLKRGLINSLSAGPILHRERKTQYVWQ